MQIVRTFRAIRASPAIRAELDAYGPDWNGRHGESVPDQQLRRFNELWSGYANRIPMYRDLRAAGKAPDRFGSLEELCQSLPVIDKQSVRDRKTDLTDPLHPAVRSRITGGSTGEPTHMPAWASEFDTTLVDKWIGRSFYGISPRDKLFTIWGHSHLLGKGLKGRFMGWLRQTKDNLIRTHRFSAYDLSPDAARRAADLLISTGSRYIIAYSSALEFFCRTNEDRAADFAKAGLKMALATGEVFPTADGPDVVRRVLGCPVAMEYGSVETDILAHTTPAIPSPDSGSLPAYRVFWRRYMLECEPPNAEGPGALLVTSLFPRAFPLIRYRIGDHIALFPGDRPLALTRIASVAGRTNSFIQLSDGRRVHTMGIKHCVEGLAAVNRFQLVQIRAGTNSAASLPELRIVLAGPGAPDATGPSAEDARKQTERAIREKAARIHPDLGRMPIYFDRTLIQTQAGKTPMIADLQTSGNPPTGLSV
ncbi:MAG: hypothetical protein IT435_08410 [Phycisphaerales bacterium]|nr:hypothetical protein [Phycisphaerales bacterium]